MRSIFFHSKQGISLITTAFLMLLPALSSAAEFKTSIHSDSLSEPFFPDDTKLKPSITTETKKQPEAKKEIIKARKIKKVPKIKTAQKSKKTLESTKTKTKTKTKVKVKAKLVPKKKIAMPRKKPRLSAQQRLAKLMKQKEVWMGNPVFIRIYKKEAQLELWMRSGKRFTLLKSYRICKGSGRLGPKLAERDYQNPEGFYTVGRSQMKPNSAYHRAFNIGFPNKYDRAWGRTGSLIMVHGACQSVGCFAMTNHQVGEIYKITDAALRAGQKKFQVHIFPFRMTAANIDKYRKHFWKDYWWNLKQGHDIFEQNLLPPIVSSQGRKYVFAQPETAEPIQMAHIKTAKPTRKSPQKTKPKRIAKTKTHKKNVMNMRGALSRTKTKLTLRKKAQQKGQPSTIPISVRPYEEKNSLGWQPFE